MPTDIEAELDALHDMTTGELADLYRELHGQPCRTRQWRQVPQRGRLPDQGSG